MIFNKQNISACHSLKILHRRFFALSLSQSYSSAHSYFHSYSFFSLIFSFYFFVKFILNTASYTSTPLYSFSSIDLLLICRYTPTHLFPLLYSILFYFSVYSFSSYRSYAYYSLLLLLLCTTNYIIAISFVSCLAALL